MRIGILTGGGDCPGLNAVIRGLVLGGEKKYGYEFLGFRDGWAGPLDNLTMPLDVDFVRDKYDEGGTMLGTSRTNPLKDPAMIDRTPPSDSIRPYPSPPRPWTGCIPRRGPTTGPWW